MERIVTGVRGMEAKRAMKCLKCGQENPTEALFCMKCGAKLQGKCPSCGAEYPEEALFCMKCGAKLDAGTARVPSLQDEAVPKLEDMQDQIHIPESLGHGMDEMKGENRLVTALFADISGFTPMAQELTPEAVVERVNQCFRVITDLVYRYEGSVNQFIGDCVLAFFGAPITHENDPERAILAALDMLKAVPELGLDVSIGINTGMTYFGSIGPQQHQEISAYGHDVNVAKRLQESAKPGQIFVGAGTYNSTRNLFDFSQLDAMVLKGIKSPIPIYEVLSVKEHPKKLRGIEGFQTRMIGREHELRKLEEAADHWFQGQGQFVSIIGEAGIGKSRLVRELRDYIDMRLEIGDMRYETGGWKQEDRASGLKSGVSSPMSQVSSLKSHVSSPIYILEGRCISIGQPISYWPFLDILRAYFSPTDNNDNAAITRRIMESAKALFADRAEEVLPFLGRLLSIRFGNELDGRLKFATPEHIRHQTLMHLRDFFETLAKRQPLLLILEDLHWADDLSLDLISLLMDTLATTPLMLLCVYRPERDHRVWQLSNLAQRKCWDRYMEINLQKLSSQESGQLVGTLLTVDNLPESFERMVLQKSEGNPFFIEEVIRSLMDQNLVYHEKGHWKVRSEISQINVPDTIQSVVLARVDQLQPETKYILQCASVIGRMFRYRLLENLTRRERDLDQYLSELEERELIYEERTVPELEYAFKHALTHEATYQSILEKNRREFHHQAAAGIEKLYGEYLEEYYEELARHYSRSDDAEKAVEYLLKAGEKAKKTYANEAAVSHFREALDMLEQRGMKRDDRKLEALRGLGEVYSGTGKSAEALETFERAIALAEQVKIPPRHLVRLYHWIGETLWWQGRYDEAIRYGEMGLEILGDDKECLEAALMNSLIAVGNDNSEGDEGKWREYNRKNMAFINKLEYSAELGPPYKNIVLVAAHQDRDPGAALDWAEELEKRAKKYNDQRGLASAWMLQGHILVCKGDNKNGIRVYQKALEICRRIGDVKEEIRCYAGLATIFLNSGDIEEAEIYARKFLRVSEQVGNPTDAAWAHLRAGDVAMSQRRWKEAISQYQKCLRGWQSVGLRTAQGYIWLGRSYLKDTSYHQAFRCFQRAFKEQERLTDALGGMEEAYTLLGTPEKFLKSCQFLKERYSEAMKNFSLRQWYLEPANTSPELSNLAFADEFEAEVIDPEWIWIDEFNDCALRTARTGGLEIQAANRRNLLELNLSAPRLMREFSGDFAVQVCISASSDEKPRMGGLLVWRDKHNFLRFDKGVYGQHEVRLHGCIAGKRQKIGRGLLYVDGKDESYLRLERIGDRVSAYCSVDGGNWMTCGQLMMPMDDPVQIGIHAIGTIERTIHCGSFKDGTATLFRGFRVWTR